MSGDWGSGIWGLGAWGGLGSDLVAVVSAVAVRENVVRVFFSAPVYFSGILDAGDASQKHLYSVTEDASSVGRDGEPPRSVSVVSVASADVPGVQANQLLDLTLDRPMSPAPSLYAVSVSPLVESADRTSTVDPSSATAQFTGCHKQLAVPSATSPRPRVTRDVANPQTASAATAAGVAGAALGVFAAGDDGDYAFESGDASLKKRIVRRLITPPGAFVHLGDDYGVGLLGFGKRLATASVRQQIVARAEQQVRQEPEVVAAKAAIQQDLATPGLFRFVILVRTRDGQDSKVTVPVRAAA